MNDRLLAFIREIETAPQFVDAARLDPIHWNAHLDALEQTFEAISALDDAASIETLDTLHNIIARREATIRDRLNSVARVLSVYRNRIRSVH